MAHAVMKDRQKKPARPARPGRPAGLAVAPPLPAGFTGNGMRPSIGGSRRKRPDPRRKEASWRAWQRILAAAKRYGVEVSADSWRDLSKGGKDRKS